MTGARNITVTDILLGNRTPIKLGKGGYGFKLFRRPVGISEPTSELVDSDLSRQGTQKSRAQFGLVVVSACNDVCNHRPAHSTQR
jgi:hypothetical protein